MRRIQYRLVIYYRKVKIYTKCGFEVLGTIFFCMHTRVLTAYGVESPSKIPLEQLCI